MYIVDPKVDPKEHPEVIRKLMDDLNDGGEIINTTSTQDKIVYIISSPLN